MYSKSHKALRLNQKWPAGQPHVASVSNDCRYRGFRTKTKVKWKKVCRLLVVARSPIPQSPKVEQLFFRYEAPVLYP